MPGYTPQQLDRVTQLRMKYADKYGAECDLGVDTIIGLVEKSGPKTDDDKLIALLHDNDRATAGDDGQSASKTQGTKPTE